MMLDSCSKTVTCVCVHAVVTEGMIAIQQQEIVHKDVDQSAKATALAATTVMTILCAANAEACVGGVADTLLPY